MADKDVKASKGDEKAPESEGARPRPAPRSWRRRIAFPILVLALAGLAAWWSRNRPVKVHVTYDLGPNAARVTRLELSYQQDGKNAEQPVIWEFPAGSRVQRKHSHTLTLRPGKYTVRARVHLRALGDRGAEVRKLTRRFEVSGGEDQRITLRFR